MGARRAKIVASLAILTTGLLVSGFALLEPAAQASVNLSCPDGTVEYTVSSNPLNGLSNGQSASFTVDGQTFTFTKVAGPSPFVDDTFDFTSTIAVSVVYVKGGVDTNVYSYDPAVTSGSGLHPPLNGGDQAPTISHVSFCAGGGTTTTTVPETTTTEAATTTTVPETTTTEAATTTTVPETTTTEAATTTTVPETTTTEAGTTTTLTELGSTTIFVTTTSQAPTSTLGQQGGTVATTTTVAPGRLPFTGSSSMFAALFGLSCVAAGSLLLIRRRGSWATRR